MADENLIEQIRQRAYEIWLGEGRPHGRDRVHWLRAEGEFQKTPGPAQSASSDSRGRRQQSPRRKAGREAGNPAV